MSKFKMLIVMLSSLITYSSSSFADCQKLLLQVSEGLGDIQYRDDREQEPHATRLNLYRTFHKAFDIIRYKIADKNSAGAKSIQNIFAAVGRLAENPNADLREVHAVIDLLHGMRVQLKSYYVQTAEEALLATLIEDFRLTKPKSEELILVSAKNGKPPVWSGGVPRMEIQGGSILVSNPATWHFIRTEVPEIVLKRVKRLGNWARESLDEKIVDEFIEQTRLVINSSSGPKSAVGRFRRVHSTEAKFYVGLNGKTYAKFWIANGFPLWQTSFIRLQVEVEVDTETGNYSNPRLGWYEEETSNYWDY